MILKHEAYDKVAVLAVTCSSHERPADEHDSPRYDVQIQQTSASKVSLHAHIVNASS